MMSLLIFLGPLPAFSAGAVQSEKEYPIAAGDVININVFPAQEFSKEVTVQPDGDIEIPLLGSMSVQGLKPSELEKMLTAKFSKYVSGPTITLSVRKFSFSRVGVIGQVRTTGYYEYREGMRLLELITQAGGPQDYARGAKVRIFRKVTGEGGAVSEQVIKADLEKVFAGDMTENVLLASGDVVYVPRKPYSAAAKWITDNIVPWTTLFVFTITAGIVINRR